MRTYKESSEVIVTVRPVNTSGALFTPTNARYRVDDLKSRNALVALTTLTASTSMEITIPESVNDIIDSTLAFETKVVTIEIDHGTTSAHRDEYLYRVKNLHFVS